MPEELPNLELVIKLLKMTASPNDGEAVVAIRKANDQIRKYGWDWESLMKNKVKVTIISDPFANPNLKTPPSSTGTTVRSSAPPPPGRQPPPRPTPQAPPPWQRPARPSPPPPPPRPQAAPYCIFVKDLSGIWTINSDSPLTPGSTVAIKRKDGSIATEKVGAYISSGYFNGNLCYSYKIDKGASRVQQKVQSAQNKWQRKTPNINIQDLF